MASAATKDPAALQAASLVSNSLSLENATAAETAWLLLPASSSLPGDWITVLLISVVGGFSYENGRLKNLICRPTSMPSQELHENGCQPVATGKRWRRPQNAGFVENKKAVLEVQGTQMEEDDILVVL